MGSVFAGVEGYCLLVVGFVAIVVIGIVTAIGRSCCCCCWRRGGGSTCYAW